MTVLEKRSRGRMLLRTLLVLMIASCASGGGEVAPSTPTTTVIAWTGPGGSVQTVETKDGQTFVNWTTHATNADIRFGPAVAHNKQLAFMLMWISGPELQYKIGTGGLATATSGGVIWEQSPTTGRLAVFPQGNSPTASPTLAYGNHHWVVVYRQGSQLFAVRIGDDLTGSWEAPQALVQSDIPGGRPIVSQGDPALSFVQFVRNTPDFSNSSRFVLMYRHPSLGIVASTSQDGLIWDAPTSVAPTRSWEKDPALTESTDFLDIGRFHAVLTRSVSSTGVASGESEFIFMSPDGHRWIQIDNIPGPLGSRGAAVMPATPAAVYGSTELGSCPSTATSTGGEGRSGSCYLLVVEAGAVGSPLAGLSVQRYADQCAGSFSGLLSVPSPRTPLRAVNQSSIAEVGSAAARPAAANGYTFPHCR
jgi:hypothetical protein